MNSNVRAGSSPALSTKAPNLVWSFFYLHKINRATFVISKKNNGDFKFVFTSRKGKIIFTSSAYLSEDACESVIEQMKSFLPEMVFVTDKSSGNKYLFKIMLNDELFAISRKYTTLLLLQKGIDEIKSNITSSMTLNFSKDSFVFSDSE